MNYIDLFHYYLKKVIAHVVITFYFLSHSSKQANNNNQSYQNMFNFQNPNPLKKYMVISKA